MEKEFMHLISENYGIIHRVINEYIPFSWQSDVQQDIIMAAYNSFSNFRGESKFSTWLYKIALFQCIDWCRKEESRRKRELQYRVEDEVVADWDVRFVKGFDRISEFRQHLLILKYLCKLPTLKIAKLTGKSAAMIRTELFRTRNIIRKESDL